MRCRPILSTDQTASTIVAATHLAACILLVAALSACIGGDGDSSWEERPGELEDETRSLDARDQEPEGAMSNVDKFVPVNEQWSGSKDGPLSVPGGTSLERTVRLVEDSGREVYYVDHPEREDRAVLVVPLAFVDGETPLIVSLHGYGGNSADHAAYLPLHERVDTGGFGLLLPNGTFDGEGSRLWNPTDRCCEHGKTGGDDVTYLTDLVASARKIRDFGAVYFFGYSNGGFMSYHIACKGLPGLRAVASLAGTSYVNDSSCKDALPISVLHIHGTLDEVILFEGDADETAEGGGGEPAFYAGARDMLMRWRPSGRLRVARIRSALWSIRSGPIRAGLRNPCIPPGSGLRRGNRDRALDGRGHRPFPWLRRLIHRCPG